MNIAAKLIKDWIQHSLKSAEEKIIEILQEKSQVVHLVLSSLAQVTGPLAVTEATLGISSIKDTSPK